MTDRAFNRLRMNWLNGICQDSLINDRSFRVAFVLADHLNSVTGHAWPSIRRIANRLDSSGRTIQRGVGELERRGWLTVSRRRDRSNHYRISFPKSSEACLSATQERDIVVLGTGQSCHPGRAKFVRETYLSNLSKTSSTRLGEGSVNGGQERGRFELRIAERFGTDIWDLFEQLEQIDSQHVQRLCDLERAGTLSVPEIEKMRLLAKLHST